jgi:predicted enzyme related to lactoylglutathione lyase
VIGTFRTVALDAPDHLALARFYLDLFDGEQLGASEHWAVIRTPDGWRIGFQPAPDHLAPRWPDPSAPQQIHLDLQVPDIDVAAERAEKLGATRIGGGETWHVMADPAGHPFCLCAAEMTEPMRLYAANLDCADPPALAAFYAAVLGMDVKYEAAEGAWVGTDEPSVGQLLFQQVDGYQPPQWPDPAHPQQLHLEVSVDDIDQAEAQVLALGATRLPGDGGNWRVYADPAGHPFCLLFAV